MPDRDDEPLRALDGWVVLGLVALTVALGAAVTVFGVTGVYHDDGIYVASARALAQGHGYRVASLPGTPLQTKYPPIYPALLAALTWIWPRFPADLALLHAANLLIAGIAVGASYAYLVRWGYAARGTAGLAGLLVATSATFLWYAGMLLSEMTYLLLLVLALWWLEAVLAAPTVRRRDLVGLGVCLALPFACRVIGLVAPLAVGLGLVVLRRRRDLPWVGLGAALVAGSWAGWVAWSLHREPAVPAYYTRYAHPLAASLQVPVNNALHLLFDPGLLLLGGVYGWVGHGWVGVFGLVAVALGALPIAWAVVQARRGRLVLPALLLAYFAVLLIYPWPPIRYLVPVQPFLFAGALWVAGRGPRWAPRATAALAVLLAALGMAATIDLGRLSHARGYPAVPFSAPETTPRWASWQHVFAWIDQHTAPDAVIACPLDPVIYLYTGRHAFRPFHHRSTALFYGAQGPPLGPPEEMAQILRRGGADYLATGAFPGFAEAPYFARQVVEATRRGWLVPVWADPEDGRFAVYAVHLSGEP